MESKKKGYTTPQLHYPVSTPRCIVLNLNSILRPQKEGSPTEDVHKLLSEGQEDASGSLDSTDEDIVLAEYVSEDESMKNERYYSRQECYPSNNMDYHVIWELHLQHTKSLLCFCNYLTNYCSVPRVRSDPCDNSTSGVM